MMEFNIIGRGASSVVRPLARPEAGVALTRGVMRGRACWQVKKAIHVPSHRFVALKCISVLEKARPRPAREAPLAPPNNC